MCITTKTAADQGTGSVAMIRRRGTSPPAEAAMTTIPITARHNTSKGCNFIGETETFKSRFAQLHRAFTKSSDSKCFSA
jgi:hypothetical protein